MIDYPEKLLKALEDLREALLGLKVVSNSIPECQCDELTKCEDIKCDLCYNHDLADEYASDDDENNKEQSR